MPDDTDAPKRSTTRSRSTSAKSSSARKPASRASTTKSASASRSTAAKKPAARKPAGAGARRPTSATSATATAPAAAAAAPPKAGDPVRANLMRMRDLVSRGVIVSRDRIQETMDDAVKRGRLVRRDADELTERLVASGRQQTQDIVADIEQLLGRGREQVGTATRSARVRATRRSEAVLREVDRARRRAGIGSFPILGYDDLTAEQIVRRLPDLSPAELRKVRDYELRHGNRKSVLAAIERRLA